MKEKVLLGMSGGVDSSVSAILLQKAGYEVIGCTMNLLEEPNEQSIEDAKNVCKKLGIEHHVFDCRKEFRCQVIDKFIKEYENAKTPNPCVECNKYLKFGVFYEKAKELGCKYIATGHYAKKEYSEKYQQYVLRKSNEEKKDQTYFLYTIPREKIENIIFPLQDNISKDRTRELAEEYGLEIANKKDSEDICFIPDNDYVRFLEEKKNFKPKEGSIVNKEGKVLGKHNGLYRYTIGQRKGLGISNPVPLYVIGFNIEKNELIVGEEKDLYSDTIYLENFNNLLGLDINNLNVKAKIRYAAKEADATIFVNNKEGKEEIKVVFKEKQRAVTKGQSLVAYIDDIVLGGGIIK